MPSQHVTVNKPVIKQEKKSQSQPVSQNNNTSQLFFDAFLLQNRHLLAEPFWQLKSLAFTWVTGWEYLVRFSILLFDS